MEIILKKDVDNLGHKNDIVNVRPGYANNCLIPQGFAILATVSAKKMLAEDIKQQAHKETKLRDDASAIAASYADTTVEIAAKVADETKIFGSITTMQVAEALEAKGFNVEKKNISMESIKELGSFEAIIKIYKDIKATVTVNVVAE